MVDPVAALTADLPLIHRNPLDDNDSPGVAGFGPAPGSVADTRAGGTGSDPLGFTAPRQHTRWTAQPAGGADDAAPRRLWTGVAVTVALVIGVALMVRRFRLWGR